jgi:hypothetical protein
VQYLLSISVFVVETLASMFVMPRSDDEGRRVEEMFKLTKWFVGELRE